MSKVAIREFRNHTAQVVDRVRAGESIELTSNGEPVARIVPIRPEKRRSLTRLEVLGIPQTDPGLREDLLRLGTEETDSIGPLA